MKLKRFHNINESCQEYVQQYYDDYIDYEGRDQQGEASDNRKIQALVKLGLLDEAVGDKMMGYK